MPLVDLWDLPPLLHPGQTVLGLDPGKVVIGVALADPGLCVASPLIGLQRRKLVDDLAALAQIMRERFVGGFVIGLPKNMDGTEGPAAQAARAFARSLLKCSTLPILDPPLAFWDERFSTAAVERALRDDNASARRRAAVVDKAAAAYILQGALDTLRSPRPGLVPTRR